MLTLEEAVRKMTSQAADAMHLRRSRPDRAGQVGDLVLFDAATVVDRATFADPLQPPIGIEHVVVAGVPVVDRAADRRAAGARRACYKQVVSERPRAKVRDEARRAASDFVFVVREGAVSGRATTSSAKLWLHNSGTPCVLATVVRTVGLDAAQGAARMIVLADGSLVGTIGGGRVEKEVVDAALALLAEGDGGAGQAVALPPDARARHVLRRRDGGVRGAADSRAAAGGLRRRPRRARAGAAGAQVGFAPIVVEEAEEMATPRALPRRRAHRRQLRSARLEGVPLDAGSYVVIVTRDHARIRRCSSSFLSLGPSPHTSG